MDKSLNLGSEKNGNLTVRTERGLHSQSFATLTELTSTIPNIKKISRLSTQSLTTRTLWIPSKEECAVPLLTGRMLVLLSSMKHRQLQVISAAPLNTPVARGAKCTRRSEKTRRDRPIAKPKHIRNQASHTERRRESVNDAHHRSLYEQFNGDKRPRKDRNLGETRRQRRLPSRFYGHAVEAT